MISERILQSCERRDPDLRCSMIGYHPEYAVHSILHRVADQILKRVPKRHGITQNQGQSGFNSLFDSA